MTHEQFIKEMEEKNPTIEVLGTYINNKTPIHVRCKNCGRESYPTPAYLRLGKRCANCYQSSIRKTTQQFKDEVKAINPNIEILSEYNGARKPIKYRCNICNSIYEATPNRILIKKAGCKECGIKRRAEKQTKTQEIFLQEMKERNPNITILGEYTGIDNKIKCQCNLCGHIWTPKALSVWHGTGCPACSHAATSFMEQAIYGAFCYAIGEENVLSRNRTAIGKELDIYIPNLKIAIEPGSWHYHKKKIKNDIEKRELCQKQGIRLITIYSHFKEEEPPFQNDCFVFSGDYGTVSTNERLKQLISTLFTQCNIQLSLQKENWDFIFNNAYIKSRIMTTEQFTEIIKKKNENIEVLGEYKNSQRKIKVRCTKCGTIWERPPEYLMNRNANCPECSADSRFFQLTHEQFIQKLQTINPNIKVLGQYKNMHENILCECLVCNHQWNPRPINIINGHGCPQCAIKNRPLREKDQNKNSRPPYVKLSAEELLRKKQEALRNRQEEFEQKVLQMNPNFTLIGEYTRLDNKIRFKCNKCGIEKEITAGYLLNPYICQNCNKILIERKNELEKELQIKTLNEKQRGELLQELDDIEKHVIIPSNRISHLQYIKRAEKKNPHLEVIGTYVNQSVKIKCRCNNCGYEWELFPQALIRSTVHCPSCSEKGVHFNNELFIERMKSVNPNVVVLGSYINTKTPIKCYCKKCNNYFSANPKTLLKGGGCNICASVKKVANRTGKTRRKTHEQFIKEIKECNPTIEIIGQYINNRTKVQCKCKICGETWEASPKHLLHGHGCPNYRSQEHLIDKE